MERIGPLNAILRFNELIHQAASALPDVVGRQRRILMVLRQEKEPAAQALEDARQRTDAAKQLLRDIITVLDEMQADVAELIEHVAANSTEQVH